MIAIKTQDNLVSVSVMGEFTLADYKEFEQEVEHDIQFQGGVNLLMDLRDMVRYTLDVAWEEIKFSRQHRYDFRKIAVVTGDEWMVWAAWMPAPCSSSAFCVFSKVCQVFSRVSNTRTYGARPNRPSIIPRAPAVAAVIAIFMTFPPLFFCLQRY